MSGWGVGGEGRGGKGRGMEGEGEGGRCERPDCQRLKLSSPAKGEKPRKRWGFMIFQHCVSKRKYHFQAVLRRHSSRILRDRLRWSDKIYPGCF